jgi:hypothetical protein
MAMKRDDDENVGSTRTGEDKGAGRGTGPSQGGGQQRRDNPSQQSDRQTSNPSNEEDTDDEEFEDTEDEDEELEDEDKNA